MINELEKNKGFTLVELLTAVSIFIVIMTISMSSIIGVFDANRKSRSLKTVMNNLNLALESMTREIRFGRNYHCGDTGTLTDPRDCSADVFISFLASDNTQVSYRWNSTTNVIEKKIDNGNFVAVTAPEITMEYVIFSVTGSSPSDALQPKVIIGTRGHAGSRSGESRFVLQTLVSQRMLDN